jgi:hypothetical protein
MTQDALPPAEPAPLGAPQSEERPFSFVVLMVIAASLAAVIVLALLLVGL